MEERLSLFTVCVDGDLDTLKKLLESGRDPNESDNRGRSCLHISAGHGRVEMMKILLDYGADITAVDSQGNTPLHFCGHEETVNLLIQRGADVKAVNNFHLTPLMMAKRKGVTGSVLDLLETAEKNKDILLTQPSNIPDIIHHNLATDHSTTDKDIFQEFFDSLGFKKFIIVILLLLVLSFAVALMVTGRARYEEERVTLDGTKVQHVEL